MRTWNDGSERLRRIQQVADHAVSELWFEPGRFRRHDRAGVGDRHEVAHLRWIERECNGHRAGRNEPLELAEAAAAPDEVDALIATWIGNVEDWLQDVFGKQRDRQPCDRVTTLRALGPELAPQRESIPAFAEKHANLVRARRTHRLIGWLDGVMASDVSQDLFVTKSVQIAQHAVV